MPNVERRFVPSEQAEIRAGEGESRKVGGYFAKFNDWSPVYFGFRERIDPGFFDDVLADDVRALFNHDDSRLLGRSKASTLRISVDSTGLLGEIDPVPKTPTGSEVLENLRLGNLTGASFAFSLPPEGGDVWKKGADNVWERTLMKAAQLFDVSVVTNPWYPSTSVGMRAVMGADTAEDSLKRFLVKEGEGQRQIERMLRELRLAQLG